MRVAALAGDVARLAGEGFGGRLRGGGAGQERVECSVGEADRTLDLFQVDRADGQEVQ
jgi:hypothetical protein